MADTIHRYEGWRGLTFAGVRKLVW
jgi:hypothetical protein